MSDSSKPTYDQLSALCAQMAAALEDARVKMAGNVYLPVKECVGGEFKPLVEALTAYRTLSPDPQWQRVADGCVVVPKKSNAAIATAMGDVMDKQDADSGVVCWYTVGEECWAAGIKAATNRARGEG